jgi:hypothetical protein
MKPKRICPVTGECYTVQQSQRKNKQYKITLKTGKEVHFGDPNSTLGVNNPKRRASYCARSAGIKTTSPYSPNALSRLMWKC